MSDSEAPTDPYDADGYDSVDVGALPVLDDEGAEGDWENQAASDEEEEQKYVCRPKKT